jgi:uncharacterized protein (TIGR02246 family)
MRTLWLPLVGLVALSPGIHRLNAQRAPLTPLGNYHAHLVSESSAKILVVPPLPSIELPAALDQVVRDWERFAKAADAPAIAALFAEDGLFSQPTGWVRGRDAIRSAAGNQPPADLRVRAHQVSAGDSVATVVGSVATIVGGSDRDIAKVTFTFRRGADGRWLIASFLWEMRPAPTATSGAPFTAAHLIEQLDSARIQRALVLSVAYWFGSTLMPGSEKGLSIAEEYARVRAENDWVAAEAAKYPNRLVAYCSVHPLKSYALEEIERCGKHPGLHGLKLHLANSQVDLRKPDDLEQLRRVFRSANDQKLPIVAHIRPRLEPYGREDSEIFLREILPQAPDIPIQIAHLVGWGSYDNAADEAAAVFAEAVERKDPATKNLYFDITTIVFPGQPPELQQRIARRIRQFGLRRVVYGSDLTDPRRDWATVLRLIPLTRAEFAVIARNATPYLLNARAKQ